MLSSDQITQLKAAHPGASLTALEAAGEVIVIKPLSRVQWKAWRAFVESSNTKSNDNFERLILEATVFPDRDAVLDLLGRQPGLAETFGARITKECGFAAEVEAKKL